MLHVHNVTPNAPTGCAYSLAPITNIYYKKTMWNTNIFFLTLLKLVPKTLCHVESRESQLDATYFIILFNVHSMFNMFRPLIRPSSGACD